MAGLRVFISWSGARSRAAAEALAAFLPRALHQVRPWISSEDLRSGTIWFDEVGSQLSSLTYCIAVVTEDNLTSEWVHFEAGAIGSRVGQKFLCPILVGVDTNQLSGPLKQFHAVRAGRDGLRKLVRDLNRQLGDDAVAVPILEEAFDQAWPALEAALGALPEPGSSPAPRPSPDETMQQILHRLNGLERRGGSSGPTITHPYDYAEVWEFLYSMAPPSAHKPDLSPGDVVVHRKWGPGTVTTMRGDGDKEEVTIDFLSVGTKHLLRAWAPVVSI